MVQIINIIRDKYWLLIREIYEKNLNKNPNELMVFDGTDKDNDKIILVIRNDDYKTRISLPDLYAYEKDQNQNSLNNIIKALKSFIPVPK